MAATRMQELMRKGIRVEEARNQTSVQLVRAAVVCRNYV